MSNNYSLIKELSDKEKAFLGLVGPCTVRDYFEKTTGVPNTDVWRIIEDAGATVEIILDGTALSGAVRVYAGANAGEDGVLDTYQLKTFCLNQVGVTELNFKTSLRIMDLTGEFGFGFAEQHVNRTADSYNIAVAKLACIYGNNDVVKCQTSDNVDIESTDVSASFADGTLIKVEIIETLTRVLFYINGALVAVHTTNVSGAQIKTAGFASRNTNGVATDIKAQMCEAW